MLALHLTLQVHLPVPISAKEDQGLSCFGDSVPKDKKNQACITWLPAL